jgi:hypothetical protein
MAKHMSAAKVLVTAMAATACLCAPVSAASIGIKDVQTSSGMNSSSMTLSNYTASSGTDQILVVLVGTDAGDNPGVTGVSYGGTALTQAAGARGTASQRAQANATDIWYLLGPSTGVAQDIEVSFASDFGGGAMAAMILENAAQQGPEATSNNGVQGASGVSTDITTLTDGAVIVDAVSLGDNDPLPSWAPGAGIVEQADFTVDPPGTGADMGFAAGTREVASAGLVTNGWSAGSSQGTVAHSLAAFAPAPEAVIPEPASLGVIGIIAGAGVVRSRLRRRLS